MGGMSEIILPIPDAATSSWDEIKEGMNHYFAGRDAAEWQRNNRLKVAARQLVKKGYETACLTWGACASSAPVVARAWGQRPVCLNARNAGMVLASAGVLGLGVVGVKSTTEALSLHLESRANSNADQRMQDMRTSRFWNLLHPAARNLAKSQLAGEITPLSERPMIHMVNCDKWDESFAKQRAFESLEVPLAHITSRPALDNLDSAASHIISGLPFTVTLSAQSYESAQCLRYDIMAALMSKPDASAIVQTTQEGWKAKVITLEHSPNPNMSGLGTALTPPEAPHAPAKPLQVQAPQPTPTHYPPSAEQSWSSGTEVRVVKMKPERSLFEEVFNRDF